MKIMFMGTPDIAANTLEHLLSGGLDIAACVTGEDKPRGRGRLLTPTPVKKTALEHGIPVYTPRTLRDADFAALLSEIDPELIVVVAYGKILPKQILDYPPLGCVNMHVSLLPKYRGAAPMQRAIINGERQTGVSIMYMDEGLDTGDIISQDSFDILPEDDFEAIHDRSAVRGSELLLAALRDIEAGTAKRIPQDSSGASYAAKIEKEDAKIDFTKSAKELDCLVRGVTPIPGAYTYLNGQVLKIVKQKPIDIKGKIPGEVIAVDPKGTGSFTVACGDGAMKVLAVIPFGKGKMDAGDFVRGRRIALGDILE